MVLNTELLNVPQGNNSQCIYSTASTSATGSYCQVWKQWRWRERGERGGLKVEKRGMEIK